jgi:hypothetical protein
VTRSSKVRGSWDGRVVFRPGVEGLTRWCVDEEEMLVNCQSRPPMR